MTKKDTWEGDTLDTIIRDYTSVAYIKSKSELRARIENLIRKEKEESYNDGYEERITQEFTIMGIDFVKQIQKLETKPKSE